MIGFRTALGLAAVLGSTAGCDPDPAAPVLAESAGLRVHVTGGFAPADYTYAVTGRAVVGIECRSLCQFAAGDTLFALTPAALAALDAEIRRAGLDRLGKDVDYGTACCDQRTYEITWTSGGAERTLTGSDGTLPEDARELVRVLELLRRGIPPLIVSMTGSLEGRPDDPLQIAGARTEGGVLDVEVTYAGGCEAHDLDAVAWTGWMESHPVQVGVAVTHDARGDACKALVARQLRFDLDPLRRAYQASYGPGPATLNLRVGAASGGTVLTVPFSF